MKKIVYSAVLLLTVGAFFSRVETASPPSVAVNDSLKKCQQILLTKNVELVEGWKNVWEMDAKAYCEHLGYTLVENEKVTKPTSDTTLVLITNILLIPFIFFLIYLGNRCLKNKKGRGFFMTAYVIFSLIFSFLLFNFIKNKIDPHCRSNEVFISQFFRGGCY